MNVSNLLASVASTSTIKTIGKQALSDLSSGLAALGKQELADTIPALEAYAIPAATWAATKLTTKDPATLDRVNRDLDLLAADAILRVGDAGVLAESVTESEIKTVLTLLGQVVLGAAIAAA